MTAERGLGRILLVFGRVPLFLLRTPHPSDSRYGNFCGLAISSTRLLALAWRPPSSGRLWPRFAVCLLDVVYNVVDSLPPLQVVHGVQEQASRFRVVALPISVLIEIRDEHINGRVKTTNHEI